MAEITITLRDTPAGGVAVHTDFKPAIGQPCTPAQGHALEIINRTHKQWGLAQEFIDPQRERKAEQIAETKGVTMDISRKAIISDDLNAITKQAVDAGRAAAQILGRTE